MFWQPPCIISHSLFHACINLSYHLIAFSYCNTVWLTMQGKGVYFALRAWRPIAVLNRLGEVLKSVTAEQILTTSEEQGHFPSPHMGARPGWSVDTALYCLFFWCSKFMQLRKKAMMWECSYWLT